MVDKSQHHHNRIILLRWLASVVILLPKDLGRSEIHHLRIINTYKSDHNLILKYFWAYKCIQAAEKKNRRREN